MPKAKEIYAKMVNAHGYENTKAILGGNHGSLVEKFIETAISEINQIEEKNKNNKLFITEILNDLHKNGFVRGGKAESMLHDWAAELRENSREKMPPSKLKSTHKTECGH